MGRVHAQAHARLRHHFPDVGLVPELVAVADEVPGRAEQAAAQFGFAAATPDWRELLTHPRVELVSVTAPNWLHREIGVAVAEAGRHLWIEKPVGLTAADARAVADAAAAAGVQGAVGFNYRHAPAVTLARRLVGEGAIGRVTHARFAFLSDYAAAPEGALTWRYERARGGNGVLGDLASHAVDLVRFVLHGEIDSVLADTAVFVAERRRPTGATAGHSVAADGVPGQVENDDHVAATALRRDGRQCRSLAVGHVAGTADEPRHGAQPGDGRCPESRLGCPVDRSVVDEDQLEPWTAVGGPVVLGSEVGDEVGQDRDLVARSDDDAERRR
jgi:predicted dehydrogenase